MNIAKFWMVAVLVLAAGCGGGSEDESATSNGALGAVDDPTYADPSAARVKEEYVKATTGLAPLTEALKGDALKDLEDFRSLLLVEGAKAAEWDGGSLKKRFVVVSAKGQRGETPPRWVLGIYRLEDGLRMATASYVADGRKLTVKDFSPTTSPPAQLY